MKKIVLMVSAFVVMGVLSVSAKVVDRTIAKVNGKAIFLSEFEKNLDAVLEVQRRVVPKEEQTAEWLKTQKKAVIKQMIDDKLLLEEAKAKNIKVNKRDMDEGIKQIKGRFKKDENGNDVSDAEAEKLFQQELKKEGISEKEFEDRVRDQYSVVKLIDQEIKSRLDMPKEEDTKDVFDKVTKIMAGKKVEGLTEEEKQEYDTLAKYFDERSAERVSARHILIKVDKDAAQAKKDEALKKINDIKARVKKGEDFGELAQKYSDDTESAKRGGYLGAFIKGWMVPEFEKAAFKMNVGEVSDVVKTEYGYHLIKVEEKKAAQAIKYDDVKNEVAEFIYRLKMKNKYDLWMESLNKRANIEILDADLK